MSGILPLVLIGSAGAIVYLIMSAKKTSAQEPTKTVVIPDAVPTSTPPSVVATKRVVTATAAPMRTSTKTTATAAPLKTGTRVTTAKAAPLKTTTVRAAPIKTTTTKSSSGTKVSAAPLATKPKTVVMAAPALKTTTVRAAPVSDSKKDAAKALDSYLRSGGLSRSRVKEYQGKMGGLTVDGVPGPLTEKRAEQLLGKDVKWPHIEAAKSLYSYYVNQRGRDKNKIKGYQKTMGEITVDGLVGPETKKRVRAITDINWR